MKTIIGNLLDQKPGILIHQVNCLGIMGGGIALQIKQRWPHVFDIYSEYCRKTKSRVGDSLIVFAEHPETWIANCFGQDKIGGPKRQTNYDVYPEILTTVRECNSTLKLPIYAPHGIGCGLGGGDWKIMEQILEENLPETIIVKLP